MRIAFSSAVMAILMLGLGCNKEPAESASSLNTLDNFADSKNFKINTCGPSASKGQSPKKLTSSAKFKPAALSSYGAIPANMHSAILAGSGEVRVSSEAAKICANAMTSAEKEFAKQGNVTPGCWKIEGSNVVLVLPESEKAIRHGMLRLAGYVYSQVLSKAYQGKKNGVEFEKRRANLATAFKADMAKYKQGLPPGLAKLAQAKADFGNFVLAEAIDSYYCNQNTKADFKKNFPRTYQSFSSGLNSFKGDLGDAYFE